MNDHLTLTVVTPGRRLVNEAQVRDVTLPGALGQMQILPQHTELMAVLQTGMLIYHDAATGKRNAISLSQGYAEVQHDKVVVLADVAEAQTDIDLARAEKAQLQALQVLKEGGVDLSQMRKYEMKLERAVTRINVAKL